jgi:hypothetical protein
MPRYYFNMQDGVTMLDDEGLDLSDLDAVKEEAVQSSAEMLKGMEGARFWQGEPWRLWVTDQPNGLGNTVLTLEFSARFAS